MSTVLAFGAFDPLHPGHAHFLAQARSLGDRLVVALATDEAIVTLKGHTPRVPYEERRQRLALLPVVDDIVPSDASGDFAVVTAVNPATIALGYDQDALATALTAWCEKHGRLLHLVRIDAFQPNTYKSSLL